jgi:hypothetical protein
MKKFLKKIDDVFAVSDAKRVLVSSIMDTKLFWRLYFWYQLREAKKHRLQRIKDGRGPLI